MRIQPTVRSVQLALLLIVAATSACSTLQRAGREVAPQIGDLQQTTRVTATGFTCVQTRMRGGDRTERCSWGAAHRVGAFPKPSIALRMVCFFDDPLARFIEEHGSHSSPARANFRPRWDHARSYLPLSSVPRCVSRPWSRLAPAALTSPPAITIGFSPVIY